MCGAMIGGWSIQAANVINPVDVRLVTGGDQFFPALNMINGSGLEFQLNTGDPVPAQWQHNFGNPGGESWVTGAPGGYPSDWFAASGTIPTFVLDLGQQMLLDAAMVWAYSGGTGVAGTVQGNSAQALEFRFNTEAEGDVVFAGAPVMVTVNHAPVDGSGTGYIISRQDVQVGSHLARYVEMKVTDNWFVPPGDGTGMDVHGDLSRGGDRVGLGEIRFAVVPEPSSYALLLGGLLTLGALVARRSRS